MSSQPLYCMAELLRLRARARQPLDLDEMFELAEALEVYGARIAVASREMSSAASLSPIRPPRAPESLDIPPLPFSVITGGRTP